MAWDGGSGSLISPVNTKMHTIFFGEKNVLGFNFDALKSGRPRGKPAVATCTFLPPRTNIAWL